MDSRYDISFKLYNEQKQTSADILAELRETQAEHKKRSETFIFEI